MKAIALILVLIMFIIMIRSFLIDDTKALILSSVGLIINYINLINMKEETDE